ncbi:MULTISPECIES: glutathione binding-like protein [unclassified Azospirillum]|uniref:glutathione binding-like protein n=1 Tax=unclassified Azospirillum TaxID=2630922 RepID=UPI000B729135|nr:MULTISPECIES: glutathione binding-like protein [unclassified Azospirillum]SNS85023.1 glutathione S-transferase [Azospirillum sp. RU38E]SNT02396.1 glutathione S-transferase [Azospirillum sp. RU37A]
MMKSPLRILGKASSINVRKVLWTCREIGQDFVREDWGSGFQPIDTAAFRQINPNAQVPVVALPDGYLWESNSICRWLAGEAERADLLPTVPLARARVEMWMDWQATELNPAWRYAFMALVRESPAFLDKELIADSIRAWNGKMHILDDQLSKTGGYVAGENFTLADIVLGLSTNRWMQTPIEHVPLPAVADWWERLCRRPAFMEFGANGIA